MDINSILFPALSIGGIGITLGLFLGVAAKKFAVEVDPKVTEVRDALPGSNCGGCGYAGCDALARAIVSGEAAANACPVGGSITIEQIAAIMGIEASTSARQIAYIKCRGTCDVAKNKYRYYGIEDCSKAVAVPGQGPKACEYGCLGMGSCIRACQFDAITVIDGIAVVDEEKCTACGMCVKSCPKNLIELIPYDSKVRVQCNSKDKGKDVKASCEVGCIGCRLCVRACEFEAINVADNIAHVNYDKCTQCNACVEKCPVKIISRK